MLHKGGQRAVDESMLSGLHSLEKRKAKRADPQKMTRAKIAAQVLKA
jgi:hypothetical protein